MEGAIELTNHSKMHLFDVDLAPSGPTIKESNTTIPGTALVAPVATPLGLLGVSLTDDPGRIPLND